MCDMNLDSDGKLKSLADEPGIPELMNLYNDKYDAETGEFKNMTEATKKQFDSDLKLFYEAFTGLEMTPDIKQFSDIKLRNYKNRRGCRGDEGVYRTESELPVSDSLYVQYANNLNTMINTAATNQSELLSVIDDLFVYSTSDKTKKTRVNPKLTEEKLQKCVEKTRGLIIKLYMQCETDYVNGIKIYEAIIQKKIFDTTVNQIKSMQENIDEPVFSESTSTHVPDKCVSTMQSMSDNSVYSKEMLDKCVTTQPISNSGISNDVVSNQPMIEESADEKLTPEQSSFNPNTNHTVSKLTTTPIQMQTPLKNNSSSTTMVAEYSGTRQHTYPNKTTN
jgi:hypothetical protein